MLYRNGKEIAMSLASRSAVISCPDGNPIGTVISYMGLTAPKDYLICDGATYNITDYPDLADFFQAQFGTKNYFGGNGTTTFAVPDMRNLFLRGYHGEAEEQLSGDIGEKQEATVQPNFTFNPNGAITCLGDFQVIRENVDYFVGNITDTYRYVTTIGPQTNPGAQNQSGFSARPLNMAVLYCIKAAVSASYDETGSVTMEQVEKIIDEKIAEIQIRL